MNKPLLLDAYAARSCPRKTHNQLDPTMGNEPKLELPAHWNAISTKGNEFEERVFQEFKEFLGDDCVNLDATSPAKHLPKNDHISLTIDAMQSGIKVILGGYLPDDLDGGRRGKPDILIRGADQVGGRHSYYVADVKSHKVIKEHGVGSPQSVLVSWSDHPFFSNACFEVGWTVDRSHSSDWLQLAHYQRMLQAMGFAAPENVAALIGSDIVGGRSTPLVWIRLDEVTITSYSENEDRVERNVLEEYDYQFSRRQEIARIALGQGMDDAPAPLVEPIYQLECEACSWREACPTRLAPDEASWNLRIGKDHTRREWELLRANGVSTIEDLAGLDPGGEIVKEIAQRVHTPGQAEKRLKKYQRDADMFRRGIQIERTTEGAIDVPTFDVEVDFDIEWLPREPPYLYGFLLKTPELTETYHHISAFEHLTLDTGQDLARQAVQWLMDQRDHAEKRGWSFGVFHYTHPEKAEVQKALGDIDEELKQLEQLVHDNFVDLAKIVKEHFYGRHGLGLKQIAVYGAGFEWKDEEPGGLNSQDWAEKAFKGDDSLRLRVLKYNEDDVRATAKLREWMRSFSTARNE